ncbi:MAG: PTS sugar transporter subunit IIA, partial [Candidatus Omnitrophica bacterium]|nr:PTS sugar transporter subunit IIA [Candidatus Omnitrophota bacterium]
MKERDIIITTKELSKYLKLNEKTIIKMAQVRELPGFKIGNKWRFYLSTIDEYLQDKIVKLPGYGVSGFIKETSEIMPLSRLTDESCINLNLKSADKDGILYELSSIAQESSISNSEEKLLIQLKKREQMLSTALGNGIAIPHPRNPSDELFEKTGIIIGRSVKGADFESPDGGKVYLFFM